MSSIDQLHSETKRIHVEDHLNLLSAQYLVQCLDTENVCHHITKMDLPPREMKETIFTRHYQTVLPLLANNRKDTLQAIHTSFVNTAITHSSRKAWKTINRLSKDYTQPQQQCKVTANQVAHQLLLNGKGNSSHTPKRVKIPSHTDAEHSLTDPFTMEELKKGVKALANNKAAGLDDILCEQIKHLGVKTQTWLLQMMNNVMESNKFPKLWRKSRVIAILKPGKDSSLPKNYRPISLLCHTYKLFERMLLNRLNLITEDAIIQEQSGFRSGKSCTSQLLNLTQHIEDGFEKSAITGTVFVDLSAAYDTVNHKLLLNKLYDLTRDAKFTTLVRDMLSNRRFIVDLNGQKSRWRKQTNGLPQGSVLSPVLFNIYTNDQPIHPETRSFIYADDLCIAAQNSTFESIESTLSDALEHLDQYYKENHLRTNPDKTQTCSFHLRNRETKRKLEIKWCNKELLHTSHPVYLGVTLDRTLSYKQHIMKVKGKTAARNNILMKLSNTKWGTSPSTHKDYRSSPQLLNRGICMPCVGTVNAC